jgi:hypothetical protein
MKTTAAIKSFEAMVDGSGAPAVISVGEYTFACDYLGEVKIAGIGAPSAWRSRGSKAAAVEIARAAYRRLLDELSAEWHDANRSMYAS